MSIHELFNTFLATFITLIPVTNPIGNGFIVNGFLSGLDEKEKKKKIKQLIIYCFILGMGTLILGRLVLFVFGLNVAVIQLGGGFMICKTGYDLLSDSGSDDPAISGKIQDRLFYPIAFPIIMGPGTLSVILTLMASASVDSILGTTVNYFVVALAIFAICIVLYICLSQASLIMKRIGPSGHKIINKLIAFFALCIGLQISITGCLKSLDFLFFRERYSVGGVCLQTKVYH